MTKKPIVRQEDVVAIAERVVMLRIAIMGDEPAAHLADQLGLSHQQWNNWERAVGRIRVDEAMQLAIRFGVTLDWIYLGRPAGMPYELMQKIIASRETHAFKNRKPVKGKTKGTKAPKASPKR